MNTVFCLDDENTAGRMVKHSYGQPTAGRQQGAGQPAGCCSGINRKGTNCLARSWRTLNLCIISPLTQGFTVFCHCNHKSMLPCGIAKV